MTPQAQEMAHVIQFFMPDTLAEFVPEQADREAQVLQKRGEVLTEAFSCFEKGHAIDPMNPELIYRLAESYCHGDGVQEDDERARALYERAAELGHEEAQIVIDDA